MAHTMAQPIKLRSTSGLLVAPVSPNGYVEITGLAGVETVGSSTVAVVLRQGSSTGTVLCSLSLAASGSDTKSFNHAIKCSVQIYVQIIGSGTLDGSVHIL